MQPHNKSVRPKVCSAKISICCVAAWFTSLKQQIMVQKYKFRPGCKSGFNLVAWPLLYIYIYTQIFIGVCTDIIVCMFAFVCLFDCLLVYLFAFVCLLAFLFVCCCLLACLLACFFAFYFISFITHMLL